MTSGEPEKNIVGHKVPSVTSGNRQEEAHAGQGHAQTLRALSSFCIGKKVVAKMFNSVISAMVCVNRNCFNSSNCD